MATLINNNRTRTRRERTFIGGQCAACEELLEHTLAGERVLQFSCGHVAHEACFYEYIKDIDPQQCPTCDAPLALDSARGGSVLDLSELAASNHDHSRTDKIGKLTNMVRSFAQQTDAASIRTTVTTPMPWEKSPGRDEATSPTEPQLRAQPQELDSESQEFQRIRLQRYGPASQHSRNNSGNEVVGELADHPASTRQHAADAHREGSVTSKELPRPPTTMIAPPIITVRSEFPTIIRSSQQQTLTCLVTIEVPESKSRSYAGSPKISGPSTKQSVNALTPADSFSFHTIDSVGHAPPESLEQQNRLIADLKAKVDDWHGLEVTRFGPLKLHGTYRIGKDLKLWQELECYLFGEMLICVKEKRKEPTYVTTSDGRQLKTCTLKGSILIRRHLQNVLTHDDRLMLTLHLSVEELPTFHIRFNEHHDMEVWRHAFLNLNAPDLALQPTSQRVQDEEASGGSTVEDEYDRDGRKLPRNVSSASSVGYAKSATTAHTDYSSHKDTSELGAPVPLHTPLDLVIVVPVSSSMQGLKINILKDTLRFLVNSLGENDRLGLVTFGSSQGGVPLVGLTSKRWSGWSSVLSSIRPVGQKSLRADVVDGANVAMDLLMQRKDANPLSSILLISDSSTSETEGVAFVVSRAEAAKISIYSFGLGLTHKPDSMIEISSRTKASYLYVKDWMMLRECVAGCLGSLQSISHQNVKLRLRLPEGSPAKFFKISGAMSSTRRATGLDAEAAIGDLRFGDKRDILVQLIIEPDHAVKEQLPQDHWETIVSGLEALGGPVDNEDSRIQSVEEVPLVQAELSFAHLQGEDVVTQISQPTLLTITVLPTHRRSRQNGRPMTPPIPSHPSIVQRRMELLTSDMLTRALTLVSKQQHDRAEHLLSETRSILKGLSKGSLPPLPPVATQSGGPGVSKRSTPPRFPDSPKILPTGALPELQERTPHTTPEPGTPIPRMPPIPMPMSMPMPGSGIDPVMMNALDADIQAALEWISHPAVFGRDNRKAVLQAIGVIATQRGYTFRNAAESIWADRIAGIKNLVEAARLWRDDGDGIVVEE